MPPAPQGEARRGLRSILDRFSKLTIVIVTLVTFALCRALRGRGALCYTLVAVSDMESLELPNVVRGALRNTKAFRDWARLEYLREVFEKESPNVLVGFPHSKFCRGSDRTTIGFARGPYWLFGQIQRLAFMGNVDLRKTPTLLDDLQIDTWPKRMQNMNYSWWACNGAIDTGLHYDENHGGYLAVVRGRKKVLLLPPEDAKHVDMSQEVHRPHESNIFAWKYVSSCRRHTGLSKCTLHSVTLEAGDVLYIPHRWLHEVMSDPHTFAISAWNTASFF